MIPIIWLYITIVVIVISISIIVSCIFISLLLVTVGMMYSRIGIITVMVISILFDGENISFDASLVMYINSTNIPPIVIMNRIALIDYYTDNTFVFRCREEMKL